MKSETQSNAASEIRILKIATCPSMSGKSKLTYHIGCTADSKIQLRVYANTAAGFFSKEWVALTAIQQLFGKVADAKAITSSSLREIFHGKSINTPAFLFAALFSEGLVKPSTTTKRCYECTDGRKFFAQVDALAASNIDLTDKIAKPANLQKIEAKAATNKAYREAEKKEEVAITEQRDARGRGTETGVKQPKTKTAASEKSTAPASKKATTKVSPKAA